MRAITRTIETSYGDGGELAGCNTDTLDSSYSSLGSGDGTKLDPRDPTTTTTSSAYGALPSPPDTQAEPLGKSPPQQRICRAEGTRVSSQAIEE